MSSALTPPAHPVRSSDIHESYSTTGVLYVRAIIYLGTQRWARSKIDNTLCSSGTARYVLVP